MLIPINRIKVETKDENRRRFRQDFGDIASLAYSLKEYGLLHPVVVSPIKHSDYDYLLIAGERRVRAAIMNQWSEIEATVRADTDALVRKAMELQENIARKELDWPERVLAMEQWHAIKQEVFGRSSQASDQDGWTMRDTAEALGVSLGRVSQDINLSKTMRERPDIAKQVNSLPKTAAAKRVTQLLEQEELKNRVDTGKLDVRIILKHGSCLDLIEQLEDNSVDLLLTDPPFANPGIVKTGVTDKASYNVVESNVSDLETMLPLYEKLVPILSKKLKDGAHFYIFCGMGIVYETLNHLLKKSGFLPDDLPLIWDKGRGSTIPRDYSYVSSYEAIIFGHTKIRNRPLWKPCSNILRHDAIAPTKRIHPLQRPNSLLKLLIKNSTSTGHTVLDCFAGSGSTLFACQELDRRGIGFELDEGNYLRAKRWLVEGNRHD